MFAHRTLFMLSLLTALFCLFVALLTWHWNEPRFGILPGLFFIPNVWMAVHHFRRSRP